MSGTAFQSAKLAIVNAPFEADGWARAMDSIVEATGASGANLVGFGGPPALSVNLFQGANGALAERYFSRPELWGASNWRVNAPGLGVLQVQNEVHCEAYRSSASVSTADYDDAVADLDMQFGCQSALILDTRTFLGLALFRGRRQGPSDAPMLARFSALLREVHRAVRLQLAIDGEAAELMLGDVGLLDQPVILLDRYGCVSAMSPAAEDLAGDEGPLRLCGLSLQLRDPAENREMQTAMSRLLAIDPDHVTTPSLEVGVGRSATQPLGAWSAHVIRLPRRAHGLGFDPHIAVTLRARPAPKGSAQASPA